MVTVIQAYRYALDPTAGQQRALRSHCGVQRFPFNWALAQTKANLDQRAAESSYGIPADRLTPPVPWSAYSLRKVWNHAKAEVAPWWGENSKETYSSGPANLSAALTNWRDSRGGKRRGPSVRFPGFKGKRAGSSCRFTTGAYGITADRRVEITRTDPPPRRPGTTVGVDLGVKSLAVLSTGQVVPNPRHLDLAQRALRRLQRQAARRIGPDKRSKQQPSNRWRKTCARITRLHGRIANARRDLLGLRRGESQARAAHQGGPLRRVRPRARPRRDAERARWRPTSDPRSGQRVPPREDPYHPVRANAAAARRRLLEDREPH